MVKKNHAPLVDPARPFQTGQRLLYDYVTGKHMTNVIRQLAILLLSDLSKISLQGGWHMNLDIVVALRHE